MMAITRYTDYAARTVLHLACQESGTLVPIAEIAASRELPVPFVRRVVRGAAGGVSLGRPAAEISLQDVVVAMEGPVCPSPCVEAPQGCPFGSSCPVRGAWTSAAHLLEDHLRSIRFSDLAQAQEHGQAHRKLRGSRGASRRQRPSLSP
jgi:Rrf2 family protein